MRPQPPSLKANALPLENQSVVGSRILARGSSSRTYSSRFASTTEDIHAAQTLRFLVFNLELEEGLESSFLTFRDEDAYDAVCSHLLVESDGEVVGTYRMQTGLQAEKHIGFYSAQEFDLSPFEPIRNQVLELGRACVHQNHRNLSVLSMLWRGIAQYSRSQGCRYLLGCSSLTSQNPAEGLALYKTLAKNHGAPDHLLTQPLPGWECSAPDSDLEEVNSPKVPKLLNAYLSIGAKICAPPAMDREFKTIDFLTLLDLENLPKSASAFLS
jgi:putative hemolysin